MNIEMLGRSDGLRYVESYSMDEIFAPPLLRVTIADPESAYYAAIADFPAEKRSAAERADQRERVRYYGYSLIHELESGKQAATKPATDALFDPFFGVWRDKDKYVRFGDHFTDTYETPQRITRKKYYYGFIAYRRNLDYNLYMNTLKIENDIYNFIDMLKAYPFVSGAKPWYKDQYLTPGEAVDYFRELLTLKTLGRAFTALDISTITDEQNLIDAYNAMLAYRPSIRSAIDRGVEIQVGNERRKFYLAPLDRTVFNQEADRILEIYDNALKSPEKQIATLKDPAARVHQVTDHLKNPYLAFDPVKSKSSGVVTFTDISESTARTGIQKHIEAPSEQLEYWLAAPEIRERYSRTIMTDQGPVSIADIYKYGGDEEKKPNWLLWAAGGVAAALAVKQIT
jgi:hypothetical protein